MSNKLYSIDIHFVGGSILKVQYDEVAWSGLREVLEKNDWYFTQAPNCLPGFFINFSHVTYVEVVENDADSSSSSDQAQ